MCWLCDASAAGHMSFCNCAPGAPWRATRRTHELYLADIAAKGKEVPSLFTRVRGLRLEHIMINVLHTCDQGFASHVIGNIMAECCDLKVFSPGTLEDNVEALNARMAQRYKDHRVTSKPHGEADIGKNQDEW